MPLTKTKLPYDIEIVRADFPILQVEHHEGVPLVYLDNAASSQKPRLVIDQLNKYYNTYNANVHRGIHKLSEQATSAYENARSKVSKFINAASKREIIFTRGTTESINLVAQTWGRANLRKGDVVVSTVMEHHSNIVPWQILAAEIQFELKFLSVSPDGTLDLNEFTHLLQNYPVKLITITHVSNVLGTVNPVQEIIDQAHNQGALVVIDGAQSVPHMPVDVQALKADFLAFSGHKMLGPTGVGVLYGKRALLEEMPPWMGGGDMISSVHLEKSTWNDIPYKFEAGTPAIAEVIGLGYAIDYLAEIGMENIHSHEQMMTQYALERLSQVSGLETYGPQANMKGAVVAFTIDGIHPHDIAQVVDSDGIALRAGHHCAMPLHEHLGINASARASFYLYNTHAEIDALVRALEHTKQIFGTGM
ncbi:MAG: cysteine desulfurase [Anaerolineae bacterium]